MKSLALILLFLAVHAPGTGLDITADRVRLTVDRHTTSQELQKFKSDLWEKKKIRLDIVSVRYSLSGKINFLKIAIDCNDGFKGEASSTFLNDSHRIGFYRHYDDTENPFEIGSIPNQ
jgi:hypothetical protein